MSSLAWLRKGLEIRIFIYCHLNSMLKTPRPPPTFLELGPAWAKEISHQTLDTELSDLARPMAGGRAPWRLINSAAEKKICVVSEVPDASCRSRSRPVSNVWWDLDSSNSYSWFHHILSSRPHHGWRQEWRWQFVKELQTKVHEDFTISEKPKILVLVL